MNSERCHPSGRRGEVRGTLLNRNPAARSGPARPDPLRPNTDACMRGGLWDVLDRNTHDTRVWHNSLRTASAGRGPAVSR